MPMMHNLTKILPTNTYVYSETTEDLPSDQPKIFLPSSILNSNLPKFYPAKIPTHSTHNCISVLVAVTHLTVVTI